MGRGGCRSTAAGPDCGVPDTPPTHIGKYQLTDLLGQGAMGVVYRALDPLLNRYVAVKLMEQGINTDAVLRDRFLREAQAAGSLQHPNIITIFDFGEVEGHLYIAMEYIEGADLSELIERKDALPLPAKLDIIIDVLHALNYAHGRGVVHRDVKPANIRVSVDGRGKLMDFGIARLESSNLTQSGMLIGTPNYMAPEQVTSGQVSPATDIFSLGVVLYEFLSYRRTFDGDTLHAVLYKIVSEQAPALNTLLTGIPAPLQAIVEKALAKDPKDRYQNAGAMAQELTNVRTALSSGTAVTIATRLTPLATPAMPEEKPRPRRVARWAVVAVGSVIVASAAIGIALTRHRPSAAAPTAPAAAPATSPAPGSPATPGAASSAVPERGAAAKAMPAPQTPAAQPGPAAAGSAPVAAAAPAAAPTATQATAPAPAPQQAAPPIAPAQPSAAPQTVAPTPAPASDPRPEIEQLLAAYARAIESRSVAELRQVYPGLTGAQQQGWEQFFQSTRSIRARLAITRLDVAGPSADLSVSGAYDYDAGGGRTEHQPVTFRATAAQDGGAWRFRTIR